MADGPSRGAEHVRAAEVIGALCLATDLGMGFPFEHGLHTTLIATRLADRLGVDPAIVSETYYASLLSHSGCTTDAHLTAEVFGGALTTHFNPVMYGPTRQVFAGLLRTLPDPDGPALVRAAQAARRLPRMARAAGPQFAAMCEVAQMLADGVGLPTSVQGHLTYLMARWDGKDPLGEAKDEEIPLPMRIVHVAADATLQRLLGGEAYAVRVVRKHAGHGLDPAVVSCLVDDAPTIVALDREASAWEETLASEPRPELTLEGEAIVVPERLQRLHRSRLDVIGGLRKGDQDRAVDREPDVRDHETQQGKEGQNPVPSSAARNTFARYAPKAIRSSPAMAPITCATMIESLLSR
jgi:hypothetical protein